MMVNIVAFSILLATAAAQPLSNRIVNGTDAKLGEIPYIVSLRNSSLIHWCGGTIINANWVLTAAHCVEKKKSQDISIQYGVTTVTSDAKNAIKVTKIIIHEEYNLAVGLKNDVAVLMLASPIPLSSNVQPVKLPAANAATPTNAKASVAGWGSEFVGGPNNKKLQKVEIQVYSDADCDRIYGVESPEGPTNHNFHICAGDPNGGKGECNGDSGGPLFANGAQVGIVSWSKKPCGRYPGVFAKVSSYIVWIKQQIAKY